MTVIAMSRQEIDRVHVLRDLAAERITAGEAAQLMQRQAFRLVRPAVDAGRPLPVRRRPQSCVLTCS